MMPELLVLGLLVVLGLGTLLIGAVVGALRENRSQEQALCPACLINLVDNPNVLYLYRDRDVEAHCPCGRVSWWTFSGERPTLIASAA